VKSIYCSQRYYNGLPAEKIRLNNYMKKKIQFYYNVYLLGMYICQCCINFEMAIYEKKQLLGEWFPPTSSLI